MLTNEIKRAIFEADMYKTSRYYKKILDLVRKEVDKDGFTEELYEVARDALYQLICEELNFSDKAFQYCVVRVHRVSKRKRKFFRDPKFIIENQNEYPYDIRLRYVIRFGIDSYTIDVEVPATPDLRCCAFVDHKGFFNTIIKDIITDTIFGDDEELASITRRINRTIPGYITPNDVLKAISEI